MTNEGLNHNESLNRQTPQPSLHPHGGKDSASDVVGDVYVGVLHRYGHLKEIFDVFRTELAKASPRRFPWSQPVDPVFPAVTEAMASSGMQLTEEIVMDLYAYYTGQEDFYISPGRKVELKQFGVSAEIISKDANLNNTQLIALDKTEKWFMTSSKDEVRKHVQLRGFSNRYGAIARAMYHMLRRELQRKPTAEDLRDTLIASSACEGKQRDVITWLEELLP